MAGNRQYLSFVSSAASGGGVLSINLQNYYSQTNTIFTLVVTGLGVSSLADANSAYTQLNTQLTQLKAQYSGSPSFSSNSILDQQGAPVFSSQLAMATYRVAVSEHIVSIFSEANFNTTVNSNTSPAFIVVSNTPVLCTLEEAKRLAPLAQTDFTGLTDSQIITLLEIASTKICTALNNDIVVTTYIQDEVGYMQRSFFLRQGLPGIWFDGVRVKRPGDLYTYPFLSMTLNWNYNKDTGELNYIPSQNFIESSEPTSFGNEIRISYVAGYFNIPPEIELGIVQVMQTILENTGNIESLKTGTWAVKFKAITAFNDIINSLSYYQL